MPIWCILLSRGNFMEICRIDSNSLKVTINTQEYLIDLSGTKDTLARFLNFFRQLSKAQNLDMYRASFISTIEEEDIFQIYASIHEDPNDAMHGNIFDMAEGSWRCCIENIVPGQTVRMIREEDYDFMQVLKCKMNPKWIKGLYQYKEMRPDKEMPLGKEAYPILSIEDSHEVITH